MKCKTSDWGCAYHACMSNDCQKPEVDRIEKDFWGPGNCANLKTAKPIATKDYEGTVGYSS